MSINPRPKVLLLIPHLGGGGAERITELLAKNLSSQKYELHLGLITQSAISDDKLPRRVQIHALGASRVRAGTLSLLRLVRRTKPDLILSGMAHLNFLVLLLRPFFPRGTRILVRQNGTVSASLALDKLPRYTRLLYRLLYPRADGVICQSQSMAEDLASELNLSENRLAVLPNPVDVDDIRNSIGANSLSQTGHNCGPLLLGRGKALAGKRIRSPAQGSGFGPETFPLRQTHHCRRRPEEAALKAQCRALELDNTVDFAAHVERPWQLFPEATLFVLPSRHEGLPNALLEAAAGGLPIVASPASGGVSELLRDQPGVWLASEVSADALAESLLAALHALGPAGASPIPSSSVSALIALFKPTNT